MYIVHVASEFAPFAKVGGLADVMLGLSRELVHAQQKLTVILPKYDQLEESLDLTKGREFLSSFQEAQYSNTPWHASIDGTIPAVFIEAHHPARFFSRGTIYGCPDDLDRFLYFCRATVDFLVDQQTVPDVLHLHDWETAACALLLRGEEFAQKFAKTKIVITIHNLAYQGWCAHHDFAKIGLSEREVQKVFSHVVEGNGNLLKGAIVTADRVTTVSPTYAQEIVTPQGGKGLDLTLRTYKEKLVGVLNGIDTTYWNPKSDPYIDSHYGLEYQVSGYEFDVMMEKKHANKWALYDSLGMKKDATKPLVAMISRLVPQKGIEMMKRALFQANTFQFQCILLGASPDPHIHTNFTELAAQFARHPDVRIILKQEEALAHKLYAASDMFLVPSLFEPCGLTQLIALRYGAIPIVRKTGGLADTVFDIDFSSKPLEERNGYVFEQPDNEGVDSALSRASLCWYQDRRLWKQLVNHAMHGDYSWERSAAEYIRIYHILSA